MQGGIRPDVAGVLETLLALAAGVTGLVAVVVWVVATANPGASDPCRGFGPDCHPPPGLSLFAAVLTVLLGSALPALIGLGGWLHGRGTRTIGAAILAVAAVAWVVFALTYTGVGTAYLFPSAGLAVVAALVAGVRLRASRQKSTTSNATFQTHGDQQRR